MLILKIDLSLVLLAEFVYTNHTLTNPCLKKHYWSEQRRHKSETPFTPRLDDVCHQADWLTSLLPKRSYLALLDSEREKPGDTNISVSAVTITGGPINALHLVAALHTPVICGRS